MQQVPKYIGQTIRALNRYEKRAQVTALVPDFTQQAAGKLSLTLTFVLRDTGVVYTRSLYIR